MSMTTEGVPKPLSAWFYYPNRRVDTAKHQGYNLSGGHRAAARLTARQTGDHKKDHGRSQR